MAFKINLITPDNGEKFVVEMSNATLTSLPGYLAKDADLTITINRSELEDVMIGKSKLVDKVKDGKAKMEGNPEVLKKLASTLVKFDPWFEILPGTRKEVEKKAVKEEVFENDVPITSSTIRPN